MNKKEFDKLINGTIIEINQAGTKGFLAKKNNFVLEVGRSTSKFDFCGCEYKVNTNEVLGLINCCVAHDSIQEMFKII